MIEERLGYDEGAARAYFDALGERELGFLNNISFEEFRPRLVNAGLFFGLYDPEPVGAVFFEGPEFHVALKPQARGKADEALLRIADYALERIPFIVAIVNKDNTPAMIKLLRHGFTEFQQRGDALYLVRYAPCGA